MSLQDLNNNQVSVSTTINEILYNPGLVGHRVSVAIYDALSTFVRAYRSNMNQFLANRTNPDKWGVSLGIDGSAAASYNRIDLCVMLRFGGLEIERVYIINENAPESLELRFFINFLDKLTDAMKSAIAKKYSLCFY